MKPAALFDLDNTITRLDTILYFIPYVLWRRKRALWRLLYYLPMALLRAARIISNERMKRVTSSLFTGISEARADELSLQFVEDVIMKKRLYYAEALAAIQRHKENGDMLILISASYELYVRHIANALGFDDYIGTQLWRHGTTITGNLYGKNCRGKEKTHRLYAKPYARDIDYRHSYAYSDSHTDMPMFMLVKYRVAVNPDRRLKQLAKDHGIEAVTWKERA